MWCREWTRREVNGLGIYFGGRTKMDWWWRKRFKGLLPCFWLNNLLSWGLNGKTRCWQLWGRADPELLFGHVKFEMLMRQQQELSSYQWVCRPGLGRVTWV